MWSHKCRSKRYACLEIDPSKIEVQANGKIRIFVSAEMKSNDPDCRIPHLIVEAPRETVAIQTQPKNEMDRKNWPGRGISENPLKSELAEESAPKANPISKPKKTPLLTGAGG